MMLVQNQQPLASTIYLNEVFAPISPEVYTNTIYFDYNGIQGPILTSNITSSP